MNANYRSACHGFTGRFVNHRKGFSNDRQHTVNSIVGVDLDTLRPMPHVAGRGSHGGYCGPAVKPIALHMVHALAADPEITIPISGIGGIQAEFQSTARAHGEIATEVVRELVSQPEAAFNGK